MSFVPQLAIQLRKKIEEVFPDGRIAPRHTETQHFYEDTWDGEVYASVTTKTSLLSRDYYKQMAADKAVDLIKNHLLSHPNDWRDSIIEVLDEARVAHVHDLKRAGTWGTHGHDLVDKYVTSWINTGDRPANIKAFVTPEISNEGVCAGLSAVKFFDDHLMWPIASEKKIVSKNHKYAGTLDSLFLVAKTVHEGDETCEHEWLDVFSSDGVPDRIVCSRCRHIAKLNIVLCDWKTSNNIFGMGTMSKFDYALQVMAYAIALIELAEIECDDHWIIRLDKTSPKYEVGVIAEPKLAASAFLAMNEVSNFARATTPPINPLYQKEVIKI